MSGAELVAARPVAAGSRLPIETSKARRLKRWKPLAERVLPHRLFLVLADTAKRFTEPAITPVPAHLKRDDSRYTFFVEASRYLSANRIDGAYAEFGCGGAHTFRYALNTLGSWRNVANRIHPFYAFDSFEGLPEPHGLDRLKNFRKGRFAISEEQFLEVCRRDAYRISTVKGLFECTLPALEWPTGQEVAMAYVDCDYHSSTVEVLRFLRGKLAHGAILAMDDWNMYYADPLRGQKAALREWEASMADEGVLEPFLPVSYLGMSFIYLKRASMGKAVE
jgi:hypothetical protein